MSASPVSLATEIFRRAMELEGFHNCEMRVDEENVVDFIDAVGGEKGGLSSLMMASDRLAVMQYGSRLWNCGYVKSDTSGDGIGVLPVEEFSDGAAASTYRAFDEIDVTSEVGLALMIARDAVKQMCVRVGDGHAKLNPVPGHFFSIDMSDPERHEIPFESASEICAFGFRQMLENNRELVLTLGQGMDYQPAPHSEPKPSGPKV
jgi:hypothetical protein